MKKEWFFDCYCGRQFVALLEDGKLAEFLSEKENDGEENDRKEGGEKVRMEEME